MIDNTVPVTSTVNVVATATISSPTIEKTEQIENNNSDINTKNEKDSLIKNVNNSSETIDDSKTKNIVLCRICEEMILAENLGEHSKVCAVVQEQEMRLYDCSQKVKKLYNEYKTIKSFMVNHYIHILIYIE